MLSTDSLYALLRPQYGFVYCASSGTVTRNCTDAMSPECKGFRSRLTTSDLNPSGISSAISSGSTFSVPRS